MIYINKVLSLQRAGIHRLQLLEFVDNQIYTCCNTTFYRTFSSGSETNRMSANTKSINDKRDDETEDETVMDLDVDHELLKLKKYGMESECRVNSKTRVFMAEYKFLAKEPSIYNKHFILVAFMVLLLKYVYPLLKDKNKEMGKVKFTPMYMIDQGDHYRKTTLCSAIPLTYQNGSVIPPEISMIKLYKAIRKRAKDYEGTVIASLGIRVYYTGNIDPVKLDSIINKKRIFSRLLKNIFEKYNAIVNIEGSLEDKLTKDSEKEKQFYFGNYIRKAKVSPEKRPFIVGDLETLLFKRPQNAGKEEKKEDKGHEV